MPWVCNQEGGTWVCNQEGGTWVHNQEGGCHGYAIRREGAMGTQSGGRDMGA